MRAILIQLPLLLFAAAPAAAAETVPVPAFNSFEIRGGGSVLVRPGPAQVTILNGSTQFTEFRVNEEGQLKIDACNDRCPRHYNLTIEIRYPTVLPMGVKGGGHITVLPGFGPQREIAIGVGGGGTVDIKSLKVGSVAVGVNGGGLVDLRAVTADDVAVGVDGGGKVLVGHSRSIAAGVSGGGEVRYAGNPHVTTAINGGGSVTRDR
ncbi:MAG TPA: DUF2807 domain-containing protein [Sphingomicrobium sp.]|nr:DUF2807 domain-containing protein [Sphingomicrobium sp.]